MKYGLVLSLLFLFLLLPIVSSNVLGNLLTNPSFETNTNGPLYHCCSNIVTGCSYSETTELIPDDWNVNHLAQNLLYPEDGYYGVVVISEWPNNCSYIGASTCGALNETTNGYITQNIYNVSNTTLDLSYYIKKCSGYPEDCGGFWTDTKYYGNTSKNMFDYYGILIQYQEVSGAWDNFTYIGYAPTDYNAYPEYIDLSDAEGINHSLTNFNMSITFYNPILTPYDDHQYCFILDNVDLDYKEIPPHFATDYITDMTTFVSMGYVQLYKTGISDFDGFKTSSSFDGESLGYISGVLDLSSYNCSENPRWIYSNITYNDGSILFFDHAEPLTETGNFEFWKYAGGHNYHNFSISFPLLNYEDIKNVTLAVYFDDQCGAGGSHDNNFYFYFEPNTGYMGVREQYDIELISPDPWNYNEGLYGNNSLYPVIMFNGSVSGNNFLFTSYNFMAANDSSTNNFELRQYREDGIIKNIYAGTEIFSSGYSQHIIINPLIDYDEDDYFIAHYFMDSGLISGYTSNTTTYFGSGDYTGCSSYCNGTDYVNRTFIEAWGICYENVEVNSSLCQSYATTTTTLPTGLFETGEATATLFGFDYETGLFFIAIILSSIFALFFTGLFAKVAGKDKDLGLVFIVMFFVWVLIFAGAGMIPGWIVIILILISVFIAGLWFKKGLTGGG